MKEILWAMVQLGCATLDDFAFELRCRSKEKPVPSEIVYGLLVDLEKMGLIERRYCKASSAKEHSNLMWFRLGKDGKPIMPYFNPVSKRHLSPMAKASLYHGQFE